jgi:hypothetical protein
VHEIDEIELRKVEEPLLAAARTKFDDLMNQLELEFDSDEQGSELGELDADLGPALSALSLMEVDDERD